MEHQPDSEPAPAVFIGAADLEGLTGNTHSTADLGAPGTRKVDYATESRSKDERRCYGTHDTQLVSQQFGSGAIGEIDRADFTWRVCRQDVHGCSSTLDSALPAMSSTQ